MTEDSSKNYFFFVDKKQILLKKKNKKNPPASEFTCINSKPIQILSSSKLSILIEIFHTIPTIPYYTYYYCCFKVKLLMKYFL